MITVLFTLNASPKRCIEAHASHPSLISCDGDIIAWWAAGASHPDDILVKSVLAYSIDTNQILGVIGVNSWLKRLFLKHGKSVTTEKPFLFSRKVSIKPSLKP